MAERPYFVGEYPTRRRFASFENAERYAKGYVRAHLNENSVPRVFIFFRSVKLAEVLASGDNRVWVDMKDSRFSAGWSEARR